MTWEAPVLWVLAGLLVGGLAELVMKHGSYGPIADVGLGIGGSVLGGASVWIAGILPGTGSFAMAVVAAAAAAGVLLVQRRLFHRRPVRPARRRAVASGAWRPQSE